MYFDEVRHLSPSSVLCLPYAKVDRPPVRPQNGWPSTDVGIANIIPQSPSAVASVADEQAYFQLLDDHCEDLKAVADGGVGWFAHIYSDSQEPGYGIYTTSGTPKFKFAPRTSC